MLSGVVLLTFSFSIPLVIKRLIYNYCIYFLLEENTVPTIHLSLPEWLYDELKQKAEELGVQVTDLVKFYIKKGLELEESSSEENTEEGKDSSDKKYEEEIALLSAKVAQLDALMLEVLKKLKMLEEEEEDREGVEIVKNEK